ncbi:MAG: PBSX family phage terminase large subunit [Muribaculaceae bacterium]|nr:PBSX family phage terminase large subunit [Muribaculaceae bacterium]
MTASEAAAARAKVDTRDIIGPAFYDVHRAVRSGRIDELVVKGGRGSLKSSYASVEVVLQLMQHPDCHALVVRQYSNTLRDSVFAQIQWAIDRLGRSGDFKATKSPLEYTYLPTGQRIIFRGLDDPGKIKSVKAPFGYIGILWFEEADQLRGGEEAKRSVQQSVLRGGDYGLTLLSFNPPAAARNWANRYAREQRPGKLVHHSDYRQAPKEWLGPQFLAQAEYLLKTKPTRYRHEYLGEAVGNGTQVFDNIRLEAIDKKRIRTFGEVISGVDWGWYPDPWAFNRTYYDAARRTLYIFDELTRQKLNNFQTAALVKARIPAGEQIIADSAELKSCADYRDQGLRCFEAAKGPGSVNQSMKWLQGLAGIVIDPARCPDTAREFSEYEYETNREGEAIQAFVDADNHHIDAVRYATNRIWIRKGA